MPKPTFFNLPNDKRELILDIAIEEFANNNYQNASVSSIVAKAGIAKGSFYQYFEDKQDLYLYLIQLAGEEKKRYLENSTPPDPQMHLFDFLRWVIREGARFEFSKPLLAQVASRALFSDKPLGDSPLLHLQTMVKTYYQGLVQLGKAQGVIDPTLDDELGVFLLSTTFNNFGKFILEKNQVNLDELANGNFDYKSIHMEDLTDQIIGILEKGLAPKNS